MKICYLYLSAYSSSKSGVDNKVVGKCMELQNMFPGSSFIRFSTQKERHTNDFFDLITFEAPQKKYFNQYFHTKAMFKAVSGFIGQNKNNYNYFVFRYPNASFSLLRLLEDYPNLVVFEHNSNERVELTFRTTEYKQKLPFSFRPSVLLYYIESVFFCDWIERVVGKKCLKLAAGGMVVTPEIGKIEQSIYPGYKTVVISNGIVPSGEKAHARNAEGILNGVFLAGTYAEWNGIERIINSYKKSTVQDKIHLYFVGRVGEQLKKEFSQTENQKVFFIDYIDKADLGEFMKNMHFAFGTCANQKRGIQEGAVLKVREALSAGLPIVNGHPDPYLQGIAEFNDYCIYFPADDSAMDFELIHKAVRTMYDDEQVNLKIQQLSDKYLSWEVVLKPLPGFLNKLGFASHVNLK